MFFDSEKPRKFLEENGFVVTFRTFDYPKRSPQVARAHDTSAAFGVKTLCKTIVCNIKDVYSFEDFVPFVELSGFGNAEEWVDEIFRLDKIRMPLRGGFKKLGNLCFVVKI